MHPLSPCWPLFSNMSHTIETNSGQGWAFGNPSGRGATQRRTSPTQGTSWANNIAPGLWMLNCLGDAFLPLRNHKQLKQCFEVSWRFCRRPTLLAPNMKEWASDHNELARGCNVFLSLRLMAHDAGANQPSAPNASVRRLHGGDSHTEIVSTPAQGPLPLCARCIQDAASLAARAPLLPTCPVVNLRPELKHSLPRLPDFRGDICRTKIQKVLELSGDISGLMHVGCSSARVFHRPKCMTMSYKSDERSDHTPSMQSCWSKMGGLHRRSSLSLSLSSTVAPGLLNGA